MPIYEYQCENCGYQFEQMQKISENSLIKCPSCGEDGLKKLVSATAFHLKGSGWYKTDYASSSSASSNIGGATGSSGASSAEASTSNASVPEVKTETKQAEPTSSTTTSTTSTKSD